MKWELAIVTVIAGCSFREASPPAATEIDAAGPSSPTDAPAMVDDQDGDGVPDSEDNCPTIANPDQRDHDHDGRGDACDVCPHMADDGADQDGDGVGDACDPRPSQPGDHIAFFEGFYDPIVWMPVLGGATWTVSNGSVDQPATDTAYQIVREGMPDLGNVFVQARARVDQLTTNFLLQQDVGLVLGYQTNDSYYFCGIAPALIDSEVDAGKVTSTIVGDVFDHSAGAFADGLQGDWALFTARTSQPAGGPTTITCTVARNAISGGASHDVVADAAGPIGFRTEGASASFDYVFVVSVPPP
ncbi:MAG TPA: thrombospondin type 3 repeat-containing protein [Kofleriaceae bacterium]|nr:thrombospondin type 3 repeat-containing protein [Kofleriaceae bacterium]